MAHPRDADVGSEDDANDGEQCADGKEEANSSIAGVGREGHLLGFSAKKVNAFVPIAQCFNEGDGGGTFCAGD